MQNESPIIIEQEIKESQGIIWKALTEREQMKQWYFDLKEFRAEPGFRFEFYGGDPGKKYLHLCEVKEVVKEKKLSHTWKYESDPAVTLVSFELIPAGAGTLVKLTHTGVDNFDKSNPDLARKNFVAGWTEIIGSNLKAFAEKMADSEQG